MKILIALPYVPWPLNSGGNQAVYSMLDVMRREHDLTVVVRANGNESDAVQLQQQWPDVDIRIYSGTLPLMKFDPLPYRTRKALLLDYFLNSFWRKYLRYDWHHYMDGLDFKRIARYRCVLSIPAYERSDKDFFSYIGELASTSSFDMVQAEFYEMLPLVNYLPDNIRKVFVHHEIRYVRAQNELDLLDDATICERAAAKAQKEYELSLLASYDNIIVLTDHDKNVLSEYLDENKIYVSPAIVRTPDSGSFKPCFLEYAFVGGSDHYPNMDAVLWLCDKVLPVLRAKGVAFKIHIAGRWDKRVVKVLCQDAPELVFEGYVPDSASFLSGRISLVPIRIGSGMRMKILEAAWACSPFITTVKGVEGLDFVSQRECIIEDDPEAFATAMTDLAADVQKQRVLASNAREKISRILDSNATLERRLNFYKALSDEKC